MSACASNTYMQQRINILHPRWPCALFRRVHVTPVGLVLICVSNASEAEAKQHVKLDGLGVGCLAWGERRAAPAHGFTLLNDKKKKNQ